MPFDEIDKLSTTRLPATMSLASARGGARPRCFIGLATEFVKEHRIVVGDRFQVLIGSGEHKGLLRLKRNKAKGIVSPKLLKGGATFNLGHLPQLGMESHPRERCDARMVDADTIEVRLPDWVSGARLALPPPSRPAPEPATEDETPAQKRERLMREQKQARNERLRRLGM